jgi:hypothetical protein
MNSEISELFIKFCPIVYFHKDEPYFPADFDDILKIANVKPEDLSKVKMVEIKKKDRFNHPVGKQILCKTDGFFTVGAKRYIDMVYVVTFTWNGTRMEHSFDKEEIVVRLLWESNKWDVLKVFGSSHGNGRWFKRPELSFEGIRPVMYSANESHAMYNEPRVHKRIFGFGNDITGQDKRWEPSEFVVFGEKVAIYNKSNTPINPSKSYEYFLYNGDVGDSNNKQEWAGSIKYDTINLNAHYKFQGGIDNLFNGKGKEISTKIRILVRTLCIIGWVVFTGYLLVPDILDYRANVISAKKMSLMIFLHILLIGCVFISGSYLGIELFVLSPIYDDKV